MAPYVRSSHPGTCHPTAAFRQTTHNVRTETCPHPWAPQCLSSRLPPATTACRACLAGVPELPAITRDSAASRRTAAPRTSSSLRVGPTGASSRSHVAASRNPPAGARRGAQPGVGATITPSGNPTAAEYGARADAIRTVMPTLGEVLQRYVWMLEAPLEQLMARAAGLRNAGQHGGIVTFSPKVFLPLTRLCRDSCGYCTFAQPPRPGRRAYMTLDEVLQVAALGAFAGCSEALFTLGDKPEVRWRPAAAELAEMGYGSTLEYVEAAAGVVFRETGLLPHINAGVLSEPELRRLKKVSASQGLMLESTSLELMLPGGAHHGCPDKDPAARLETIEAAGRAGVPFTSGILVGIGDSRADRLHALACLHRLHDKYGHIQELIIQNFRAKGGTAMAGWPEPPLEELLWAVAAARIMFGPNMNIQVPPNLTPLEAAGSGGGGSGASDLEALQAGWRALLDAGINDWGGISPITYDFVNPERPWPHLAPLAAATAAAAKVLLPRLPVYPPYLGLRGGSSSSSSLNGKGDEGNSSGGSNQSEGCRSNAATELAGDESTSGWGSGRGASLVPPWLCFERGRESVGAAVLRAADGEGFLRASEWVAGRPERHGEGEGEEEEGQGSRAAGWGPADRLSKVEGCSGGAAAAAVAAVATPELLPAKAAAVAGSPTVVPSAAAVVAAAAAAAGRRGDDGHGSSNGGGGLNQHRRAAVPLPRAREGRCSWRVAVGADGALEGLDAPKDPSPQVVRLLDGVLRGGRPLQQQEVELLLRSRGADFDAVCAAADELRRCTNGDTVSYVVNRNINYTNVCTYKCSFCAFSKGRTAEELRGPAYVVPYDEITRRTAEAWDRGATEVCMQGGIHPDFTGHTYLRILQAAKEGAAAVHVHAFSPLEVHHGATTLGLSYERYLEQLTAAGLGSLPGTAAEVLCDDVRRVLCPDKIDTATWLEVVAAAHRVGLRTTSTLMFGSVEAGPPAAAAHLMALRGLQQRAERAAAARGGCGVGITEFVPLPFVHMESPVYLKGLSRRGPTLHEGVLLHAVSRLALHPHVSNVQASWVKMGPSRAAQLLAAGCNDMGGSIMNETITRAAGASHGQELPPPRMDEIIRAVGRQPRQRTTLYGTPPAEQTARSYGALPLRPLVVARPRSGALS